ncbi:uncharacterized protein CCDC7 isoform X2 [Pyxicephalus adspersus]|uniref:uncharacterized protein CCDC7 isoform X2 n=1 Tax=Pyxicephalus adspersus TaxID=30357 RepID=UPI003B5C2F45
MRRTTESSVNGKNDTNRTPASRKKTTPIPKEKQLTKTAVEEPFTMEKKPAPEVETVLQYAIPLAGPESRIRAETSINEMKQIRNKLSEYVRNLEDMYNESSGEMTKESSPAEKPLCAFLSTCHSAANELDITIHAEYQILESLHLWYGKEVQLLEQLIEADMTTTENAMESPDTIAELIDHLKQSFHKLDGIKSQFQDLLKTYSQDPPSGPVVEPITTVKKAKKARDKHNLKNASTYQGTQNVVTKLQNLISSKDAYTNEAFEKIIQEVGKTINSQEDKFEKLEKENKETEQKYTRMKAAYQVLLEEKIILENELKQIFQLKLGQKPGSSILVKAEYKPERVMLTKSPAVLADSPQQVLPVEEPETFVKQADDTKLEELQKEPTTSGAAKNKRNLQLEKKGDFSKIHSTWNQDQGAVNEALGVAEPANVGTPEIQESSHPHSETRAPLSITDEKIMQGSGKKVNMTQNVKSATDQDNRPSATSATTMAVSVADNMTSHINQLSISPGIKPTDLSHAENMIEKGAENLTHKSILGKDERKNSVEDKVKPKSDLVHEIGHTEYIAQPDRLTETSDSSEQQHKISIAIHKSLDVQSSKGKILSTEQKQTPSIEQTAEEEEEEQRGTLGKNQVQGISQTIQENGKLEHVKGSSLTPTFETTEEDGLSSAGCDISQTPDHRQDIFPCNSSGLHTNTMYNLSDSAQIASGVSNTRCVGAAEESNLPNKSLSDTSADTMKIQENLPSINETLSQHKYSSSDEPQYTTVGDLLRMQLSDGIAADAQFPPKNSAIIPQQHFFIDGTLYQNLMLEPQKAQLSTMYITAKKLMPNTPLIGEIFSDQQIFRGDKSQFTLLKDAHKTQLSRAPIKIQTPVPQDIVEQMSQNQFHRDSESHQVYATEPWGTQISAAPLAVSSEMRYQGPLYRKVESHFVSVAQPGNTQISTAPETTKKTADIRSPELLYRDDKKYSIVIGKPRMTQISTAPTTATHTQSPQEITDGNLLLGEPEEIPFSAGNKKQISYSPLEVNSSSHYNEVEDPLRSHLHTTPIKTAQIPTEFRTHTSLHFSTDGRNLEDPWKTKMLTSAHTRKQVAIFLKSKKRHFPLQFYRNGKSLIDPWRTQTSRASIHSSSERKTKNCNKHQHPIIHVAGKSLFQPQKCEIGEETETKGFVDYQHENETQEKAAEGTGTSRPHKPPVLASFSPLMNSEKNEPLQTDQNEELTKQQFQLHGGVSAFSNTSGQSNQQILYDNNFFWSYHQPMYIRGQNINFMPTSHSTDTHGSRITRKSYARHISGTSRRHLQRTGIVKYTTKKPDKRKILKQLFSFHPLGESAAHRRKRNNSPRMNTPLLSGLFTARSSDLLLGSTERKKSTGPCFLVNGVERIILGLPFIQWN